MLYSMQESQDLHVRSIRKYLHTPVIDNEPWHILHTEWPPHVCNAYAHEFHHRQTLLIVRVVHTSSSKMLSYSGITESDIRNCALTLTPRASKFMANYFVERKNVLPFRLKVSLISVTSVYNVYLVCNYCCVVYSVLLCLVDPHS